jgi:hypothetical protein
MRSNIVVRGVAVSGEILTVEGGAWVGPLTPKITFYWHHCTGAADGEVNDGYFAQSDFFEGAAKVNLTPSKFCGTPPGITSGTTYQVPANLGDTTHITVSQFVETDPRFPGFGYYSYAKGLGVTSSLVTHGKPNQPPAVDEYSVRICHTSCEGNILGGGYSKRLDSKLGQWSVPNKPRTEWPLPERSWYLCPSEVRNWLTSLPTDCTLSPRSTQGYYEITSQDAGKHIRVCASASNSFGTTVQCSPTYKVEISVSSIESPRLEGVNKAGSTLTLTRGTWGGSPIPNVFVSWYSCDASGIAAGLQNPGYALPRGRDREPVFYGCLLRQYGKDLFNYTISDEDKSRVITTLVTASNDSDNTNGDYLSIYLSMIQGVS